MFNIFKKKAENKANKPKRNLRAFTAPITDLEGLYACSVQKQAKDFKIGQYSATDGNIVNVAMDGMTECDNLQTAYNMNEAGQEIIFTYFAKQGFIGFNNCGILAQDWLINKAISAPCEDAISIEYDINDTDGELTEDDKDKIAELKQVSDNPKYRIKEVCKKFAQNKRKYGQALCIPLVDNVDYSVPFNIDAVTAGSYRGMSVIEPVWVSPVLDIEASTDPTSKRFYQPTWFRLPNGKNIHSSWFIFNTLNEVSDILKPTYYFGGVPLPQMMYEMAYAAHKTAKEAPMLAQSKRLNYVEGNPNAYLADEERLNKELTLMSWLRNNWGWLLIKKDQSIGQLDTNLTDFDAVTMLGYQVVAAIAGMPSARLLETSPKGWQSTGSYEDDNYRRLQQAIQRLDFCPILDFHYRLLAKSKYGIDKKYECVFDPIDTPTEKEQAEIREINSRTDMTYINAGVVSPEEIREVLRADENSGYNALGEAIEGEPPEGEETDPFADMTGGSENPQSPFKCVSRCDAAVALSNRRKHYDGDVGTQGLQAPSTTGATDNWEENKHPRKDNGQFGEGSGSEKKSPVRGKIDSSKYKTVELPKEEYARVVHELNTNLTKEQRKKKHISKNIGNFKYTILNNGFNEYKILKKENINDFYD